MNVTASTYDTQFAGLLAHGGRVSVVREGDTTTTLSSSPSHGLTDGDRQLLLALTGLAFGASGDPDLDTARASGGSVDGAIPGGYAFSFINDGMGNEVHFFAAQISSDRKSGALAGPVTSQYVKGMTLTLDPNGSTEERRKFLDMAGAYLDRLPDNQAEAHRRRNEPTFDIRA